MGGTHGHFLRYTLDKFCTTTPEIKQLPFNSLGNSHLNIQYSGQFLFEEPNKEEPGELEFEHKNMIYIDLDQDVLYYERVNLHRAGDVGTDLFSESAIEKTLRDRGNTFPDYCKNKNISLKDGFMYGFKNILAQGSVVRNKKFISKLLSKNYNMYLYKIKNFFNVQNYKESILKIGNYFNLEFDLTGIEELYAEFYKRNTILRSHSKVEEYLNGNKSVKLDILQQAYVDAFTN